MDIVGHGIDIVELQKIQRILQLYEEDFLDQCFTELEQRKAPLGVNRVRHIAGNFAAKEAVLKALGTGFGDGVGFTDVEISRSPSGAPTVRLSGGAANVAVALGVQRWLISISHSEAFAVASALATGSTLQENPPT